MKKTALIIFAKEPKIGKVKTRLAKDLGDTHALNLYKVFVKKVCAIACRSKADEKFLFYAGSSGKPAFLSRFQKSFSLKRQFGKDLGERMYNAFRYCSQKGFSKTIIIGTDCLTIKENDIDKTFNQLDQVDCVLGPAFDGGYYLIGLKKPLKNYFNNIPWGTDKVFEKTTRRLKNMKKKIYYLKKKHDVDDIQSLEKVVNKLKFLTRNDVLPRSLPII